MAITGVLLLIALNLPFKYTFGAEKTPVYTRVLGFGADFDTSPESRKPFYFSVAVPEGNFKVTVALGSAQATCDTVVKAESRRLMVENVHTTPGMVLVRSFFVNVRNSRLIPPPPNAPGGSEVRLNDREQGVLHWDDKLTLEFNGARPCVASVEVAEAGDIPTIFLAGDSTVTDQSTGPTTSWGQMLPRFFNGAGTPGIAIANHAESGETLKSFVTGLRMDKVLSQMKKGDYLFIQFGHNDQKEQWPQTYVEAMTTYKEYLRTFIAEARRRGGQPVLVTPMHRRAFDAGGKVRETLGDYPEAMRQVAKEEDAPLIDLHAMSAQFYEALGPEKSAAAFAANGRDTTHHSAYGAYELARAVVQGIKDDKLDLVKYIDPAATAFDPSHPDSPESFVASGAFPASPALPPRPQRNPTLWVIGDSTVRNGNGTGANGQWGWGDQIWPYFDTSKITLANRALGGRSSRTFVTEGHWEEVLNHLQPGDYVMMQFGHNDSSPLDDAARARGTLKGIGEETQAVENPIMHRHEIVHTYGWYMRKFVSEARSRGAIPIICSPIPRLTWKDNHIVRGKADYAGWSEEIAKSAGVPFVDINELIARKYDELGPEKITPWFPADHTHTNLEGAELNAACVIKGLKELREDPLAAYFSAKAKDPNACDTK
jgi:lysophospholipase L1-like esterase